MNERARLQFNLRLESALKLDLVKKQLIVNKNNCDLYLERAYL